MPLSLTVVLPAETMPGNTITLRLRVSNRSASDRAALRVRLPLPAGWQPTTLPAGATFSAGQIVLTIDLLKAGATFTQPFFLRVPLTLGAATFDGARLTVAGQPTLSAPPHVVTIVGGRVSLAVARALDAGDVAVEGDVTYVGSDFLYLQEATDGLRVALAGARGLVRVGDRVLVSGTLALAAADAPASVPSPIGALQLTATQPPLVVRPAEDAVDLPMPTPLAADAPSGADDRPAFGRLVVVEGVLWNVERLPHGLALDLQTPAGAWHYALLPGAPQTLGPLADALEVGSTLRVTGILDRFGVPQLLLRGAEDVQRLYPPGLRVQLRVPGNVPVGGSVTHTVVITNDAEANIANVIVAASVPRVGAAGRPAELLGNTPGGNLGSDQVLYFGIGRLAAGGSQSLTYTLRYPAAGATSVVVSARTADGGYNTSRAHQLYIGKSVPLATIQGDGEQSPFAGRQVVAEGVVTGVFPALGGFFMQTPPPAPVTPTVAVTPTAVLTTTLPLTATPTLTPTQPAASAPALTPSLPFTPTGLFVSVAAPEIAAGMVVTVSGVVREIGGQTRLLSTPAALTIRASGAPPRPHPYDPPTIGSVARYNERLEGVLVAVDAPAVAIAPTDAQGETLLIYARHDPLAWSAWDAPVIGLDDGARVTHTLETLPYALARGDGVTAVVGPLSQIDGRYRLQPRVVPVVVPGMALTDSAAVTASAALTDQWTVATWYAEALPPQPGLPAGLAVANVIALQGAAAGAAEALAGSTYRAVRAAGSPLAMLVQTGSVTVSGVTTLTSPGLTLIRPPLMLTVTVGGQVLRLVNVELTPRVGGRMASAAWRAAEMSAVMTTLAERSADAAPDILLVALHDGSESQAFFRAIEYNRYHLPQPAVAYTTFWQGARIQTDFVFVSRALPASRAAIALTGDVDRPLAGAHAPVIVPLDLRP